MFALNTITHFHSYARIKVLLRFGNIMVYERSQTRILVYLQNIKRKYRFGYNFYIHPTIELLYFHLDFADSVGKCIKNSCTIFYDYIDFIQQLITCLKKKREITYIWKYDNAVTNWIKSRVKLAKHYFFEKDCESANLKCIIR